MLDESIERCTNGWGFSWVSRSTVCRSVLNCEMKASQLYGSPVSTFTMRKFQHYIQRRHSNYIHLPQHGDQPHLQLYDDSWIFVEFRIHGHPRNIHNAFTTETSTQKLSPRVVISKKEDLPTQWPRGLTSMAPLGRRLQSGTAMTQFMSHRAQHQVLNVLIP